MYVAWIIRDVSLSGTLMKLLAVPMPNVIRKLCLLLRVVSDAWGDDDEVLVHASILVCLASCARLMVSVNSWLMESGCAMS